MSSTLRIILTFLGLEVAFAPLITAALIAALDIHAGASIVMGTLVVFHIVRFSGAMFTATKLLRPYEQWRVLSDPSDQQTLAAAHSLYRAPYVFATVYVGSWLLMVPTLMILTLGICPEEIPLDPHVGFASVLFACSFFGGPGAYAFATPEWLLAGDVRKVNLRLQEKNLRVERTGMSLSRRFMLFGLMVASACAVWGGGIDYLDASRSRSRTEEARLERTSLELALAAKTPRADGSPADISELVRTTPGAFLLRTDQNVEISGAIVGGDYAKTKVREREALFRRAREAAAATQTGKISRIQTGTVIAFTHADQATMIGVVGETDLGPGRAFWMMQLPFFLLVFTWAPVAAWLMSRSTVSPIQRLSEIVEQIRRGKVEHTERVAIYHHDETGKLSADVNGMIDVMRTLSAQARAIGTGDLTSTFTIGGDLGESFRAQLDSLRTIVGTLSTNSVQLSAAATELYAAAQEQETAAGHQSAGVSEVSKTMESLLEAASHISDATQGVLGKAERTRETTDRTAQRIGELSAHAGRIGEILDVIREIADRSDLLALNASLEGTRAGDAGRGFTLVAAEMRKLAERVMASVTDIKQLVADVRASVASTIMVTEESAKLADGTTESARQISLVTQQQSSGTEQAVQSMRDVAAMLTQSLSATQQMRTLAANLKGQAEQLSSVVARFRTSNGSDKHA